MTQILYGTGPTRLVLRNAAGVSTFRWTLQPEEERQFKLSFVPEGTEHDLGSGAGFGKKWVDRGERAHLEIAWDVGTYSIRETWNGSAWITPTFFTTQEAVGRILDASFVYPVLVQPRADFSYTFEAQMEDDSSFILCDMYGLFAQKQRLHFVSQTIVARPSSWGGGATVAFPEKREGGILGSLAPVQITTYDSGGTVLFVYVMQTPSAGQRLLEYTPELTVSVGAGAARRRNPVLHGWRPSLKLAWDFDLTTQNSPEGYVDVGYVDDGYLTVFGPIPTAQAVSEITAASVNHDVKVEPFADASWPFFYARTYDQPFVLEDFHGIAHTDLVLELKGTTLLSTIF